jgi:hypothetical protein
MPGKKRSEIIGVDKTQPVKQPTVADGGGKELRQVFCPMCARATQDKRLEPQGRGYYQPSEKINYWKWLKEREAELGISGDAAYGFTQGTGGGRGKGFGPAEHFGPDEDPEGFPLLKERMLLVVERWLKAGWLKPYDILRVLQKPRD